MIVSLLLAVTAVGPPPSQRCTYATLPAAEQRKYRSRYNRRLRSHGRVEAETWLRSWACPDAALLEKREAARARAPVGRDGKPCTRTRTEMRAVTGMDGSMTMIPKRVCAD